MNRRTFWTATLAVALVAPMFALAQNQGQGRRTPEERRREQMARLQERLGASADEMQVLNAKIEKVMTAQRDARTGGGFGGGRGGRGGGGGGGGNAQPNQPETAVGKASAELRTTLDNKNAPAEEINAKLAAFREARNKARADLDAARKDLVSVLTPRQEAVMVAEGLLE